MEYAFTRLLEDGAMKPKKKLLVRFLLQKPVPESPVVVERKSASLRNKNCTSTDGRLTGVAVVVTHEQFIFEPGAFSEETVSDEWVNASVLQCIYCIRYDYYYHCFYYCYCYYYYCCYKRKHWSGCTIRT